MDVKTYYQKVRETEGTITTPYAVIISLPTDDGGKKGVLIEVSRHLAAKMIVEGSAEIAPEQQATAFRQAQAAASKAANDAATAARLEVTMVPSDELKRLTDDMQKLKAGTKSLKD
ncbi:MAG TPA: hypothetical protein VMB03_10230 [Bryobacteraceae bacterium]|nr:hypothetical protein [Bryobacteraceae bacterium]